MSKLSRLSGEARQYLWITGNYWMFTLTDGALRMLVVLHFHQLGYSPLQIALLFLFYEFFGVVTNLLGGWLGAYFGLNKTMNAGLVLQIVALTMLIVPPELLTVSWVMTAQALSGIAKDLNKMSAKSAVKTLVPVQAQGKLYRWVSRLTGSKNALKGVGFFLGGVLLTAFGFRAALSLMALTLLVVWLLSIPHLNSGLGRSVSKPKFRKLLAKSSEINCLSAARLFLFSARDIWFVVALPVYLAAHLNWSNWAVGAFLASWIIGYGAVQALSPRLTGNKRTSLPPDGIAALRWSLALSVIPGTIALALQYGSDEQFVLIGGLLIFGVIFAVNSALHSYLIVSYANAEGASLDIGFYYMANSIGRLLGTVLSGWIYQQWGLASCLWLSSLLLAIAASLTALLPRHQVEPPDAT